jgi:hypothetical protein
MARPSASKASKAATTAASSATSKALTSTRWPAARRLAAAVQHDAGARLGEAPHQRETQTAGGAGDKSRFAGEVEQRRHGQASVRRTVRSGRS